MNERGADRWKPKRHLRRMQNGAAVLVVPLQAASVTAPVYINWSWELGSSIALPMKSLPHPEMGPWEEHRMPENEREYLDGIRAALYNCIPQHPPDGIDAISQAPQYNVLFYEGEPRSKD